VEVQAKKDRMASKRLRPVSRDEGFQKLRTLRCFNEVYERLLAGWSPSELARFIQESRNEYTHASHVTLMQVLQRFRDTIPPAQLMAKRLPKSFEKAVEKTEEGIDELAEMEKLYRMHMERVNIDFTTEKNIKKLMPTMTQEIRVASELLGRIADLKMDLGVSTRHLGQVDAEVTIKSETSRYGKESVKKVMEDPEKRRKVLNVAERILALPERTGKAIPTGGIMQAVEEEVALTAELEMVAADTDAKDSGSKEEGGDGEGGED